MFAASHTTRTFEPVVADGSRAVGVSFAPTWTPAATLLLISGSLPLPTPTRTIAG